MELAGERLAFTFDAEGVSVRPVGSRRQPHSCSWASLVAHLTREDAVPPAPEELAAAVGRLKAGGKAEARPTGKEPETPAPDQEPPSNPVQPQPQAGPEPVH